MAAERDGKRGAWQNTISLRGAVVGRRPSKALCDQVAGALLEPGWFCVPLSDLDDGDGGGDGPASVRLAYEAASAWFAEPSEAQARCEQAGAADTGCLGFTYLPVGSEPLYQAKATQLVRSLNAHLPLSPEECDSLLPAEASSEERELAHRYHSWPASPPATAAVREASVALVRRLRARVCEPLFAVLEQVLGVAPGALARRCAMRRSDNTSLLRLLEYPPAAGGGGEGSGGGGEPWGVSQHTDFELFSLLHQVAPGLQLRERRARAWGEWHTAEAAGLGEGGALLVLCGDMLERLSGGWLAATPHRVLPTPAAAAAPRRSLVYFVALDEEERICALPGAAVRRGSHLATWLDEAPDAARRQYAAPVTQREWTEAQESAAQRHLEDAAWQ